LNWIIWFRPNGPVQTFSSVQMVQFAQGMNWTVTIPTIGLRDIPFYIVSLITEKSHKYSIISFREWYVYYYYSMTKIKNQMKIFFVRIFTERQQKMHLSNNPDASSRHDWAVVIILCMQKNIRNMCVVVVHGIRLIKYYVRWC
jgi:hypothetical protein